MPKRTCYCPPWWLRGTMRRPFRWLPLAVLRCEHRLSHLSCTTRAQAEHDGYIDYAARYLFHDRLVFQAWVIANQAQAMCWQLKAELVQLRKEHSDA